MLFLYNIFRIVLFILSPLILFFRLINGKEDPKRFLEKYSISEKKNSEGDLIWFHGSSVGEILSVIPLVEKLEKRKNIKKILITSNTLSSSKVIKKLKLKKTFHQFFPLDSEFFIEKFLNHWKPKTV